MRQQSVSGFRRITTAASAMLVVSACAQVQPGENHAAAAVQAPPSVPLATKPNAGQEVGAVVNDKIQISFPDGGARLTPEAGKQLDLAARLFRDANPVLMFTSGYADNTGDEYTNLLLSARRAQAVKEGLVARGIPADRLLLQAFGASDPVDPADPTAAANRRVVVTWRLL